MKFASDIDLILNNSIDLDLSLLSEIQIHIEHFINALLL